jgi:hypothetical protein
MTSLFLKAKHWQLFVLIFGLPFIFQAIFYGIFTSSLIEDSSPIQELILSFIFITPFWLFSFLLAWLYSVGSGLQACVPVDLRRPTRLFKVALVFPIIYFLLIITVVFPLLGTMATSMIGGNFILIIFLGLHLFTMFCIIYPWYFAAKTVKLAELQQPVSFGDFIGDFSLFWFLPVGIWILQPRINELVITEATSYAKESST